MMAGAAGFTYGCNDIWQMYAAGRQPTVYARTGWEAAMQLPGATQMGIMRRFFEALPWQSLVPDQGIIASENPEGPAHMRAARLEEDGTLLVYNTRGLPLRVDLSQGTHQRYLASWFNPRSGQYIPLGMINAEGQQEFAPWTSGHGSDVVLVLEPLP